MSPLLATLCARDGADSLFSVLWETISVPTTDSRSTYSKTLGKVDLGLTSQIAFIVHDFHSPWNPLNLIFGSFLVQSSCLYSLAGAWRVVFGVPTDDQSNLHSQLPAHNTLVCRGPESESTFGIETNSIVNAVRSHLDRSYVLDRSPHCVSHGHEHH